ncbi:hypothetical protein ACX80L_09105 [Arthrobacter sp. MDT1-48-3]
MTGRDTPPPDPVQRLLDEAGIPAEPTLVRAVREIGDLGAGPAPDASAELARLMADGGRAPQGRRNKRRITFLGGALAVSMGAGMSGVAAGTLHLREGFDDAVVSITRFTVRNDVDRAEPAPEPLADAGHGSAVVPAVPAPAPAHVPAPSASGPAASAPADAGGALMPAPAPASPEVDEAAAALPAPAVVPAARPPAGTVRPADSASRRPDGPRQPAAPVTRPATGTVPGTTGRPDPEKPGHAAPGRATPGQRTTPLRPVREKPGLAPGRVTPGQVQDRSLTKETTVTAPETISGDTPAPAGHRRSWLRAPAGPADTTFLLDAPITLDPDRSALFPADALLDPDDPVPGLPVGPEMGELPADPVPEDLPVGPAPEDVLPVDLPVGPAPEDVLPVDPVGPADAAAPDSSGAEVAVPEAAVPEVGSRSEAMSNSSR